MVSFLSLFLGLVVGHQTVALEVTEPVTRVEILLDGRQVTALDGPPWRGQIDLGRELLPHELTAVAFDHTGVELDRTRQWLNLPRRPAETTVLLESDADTGTRVARVSWKSLIGDQPSAVRVEFDGLDLEFEDSRAIHLPDHDPELLHFLRVELEFAGSFTSTAEVTFGGIYADQVNSELTALAIEPQEHRKKLPQQSELTGGFQARDQVLRIAALEKGQVDLIVVRDQSAWVQLRRIRNRALTDSINPGRLAGSYARTEWFRPDPVRWNAWTFQFLWPTPRRHDGDTGAYDLFSHSARYLAITGSLHGWLTTVEQPSEWTGDQRLADAVAIAAVTAAGGNRRRGVLLVLGEDPQDSSAASPEIVRAYLDSLAVPLFVWTVSPKRTRDTGWGPAVNVSSPGLMSHATRQIFDRLENQRIIWLEGIHLPQQITITPAVHKQVKAAG